jgi:small-conductance mechanosensitive channel
VSFNFLSDFWPSWSATTFAHQAFSLAVILIIGLVIQQLIRYVAGVIQRHLASNGTGDRKERLARAKSLTTVLTASLSIAVWLMVLLALLDKLGINIGPFLASAGILGLAISFGSQELIKDLFAGLFFLVENQFNAGDVIQVQDKKGRVVAMSLRTIIIQDDETQVMNIIRNSQVGVLTRFPDKEAL